MPKKSELPAVPAELESVALIGRGQMAAARGVSISTLDVLLKQPGAPKPVIQQSRCTRYRLVDVRSWLERACTDPEKAAAQKRSVVSAMAGKANRALLNGAAPR